MPLTGTVIHAPQRHLHQAQNPRNADVQSDAEDKFYIIAVSGETPWRETEKY